MYTYYEVLSCAGSSCKAVMQQDHADRDVASSGACPPGLAQPESLLSQLGPPSAASESVARRSLVVRLLEDEPNGGQHHTLAVLGHQSEQVLQEMHPAPPPTRSQEHLLYRPLESLLGLRPAFRSKSLS